MSAAGIAGGGGRTPSFDLVALGRVGVDLYPQQTGVPLADVRTFAKSLGGTATNVAVAATRHGLRTAVVTGVGDDPFGPYVRQTLRAFGVDDRQVVTVPGTQTPVVFCEMHPPDDFPLVFYRRPVAPDQCIAPDALDLDVVRAAAIVWITGGGLAVDPSRTTTLLAAAQRAPEADVVFDLDWRPSFWDDPSQAPPGTPGDWNWPPWPSATATRPRSPSVPGTPTGPPTCCWSGAYGSPSSNRGRRACWPVPPVRRSGSPLGGQGRQRTGRR